MSSPPAPAPHLQDTSRHIITLLEENGRGDYIGESISQLEHCLQAANLALEAGSPTETIIAALLHDIGQFLPAELVKSQVHELNSSTDTTSVGRCGHEAIGEQFLSSLGFSPKVCRLVGSHVAAKRYLTAIDPDYYDSLSSASKKSLEFQGGPFQGDELESFKADPLSEEMVRLRKWDDGAKIVGVEDITPRAGFYEGMITEHLTKQIGQTQQ